ETTLFDILKQDPQHYSIKLYFQIESVEGDIAQTIFKGHEYSREYLRSLVRRGLSSIRLIKNYTTRDQALVQVQIVVFTQGRINTSRKHAIRSVVDVVVNRKAAELTYNQFAQEAVLGKIASDVYNSAKKVARLRHVGVSKTKLVRKPTMEIEEVSVAPPEPEEAEEVELPTTPA
ncbi:MAG: 30S ribosomal protein S3ae, partial [Nitrososphaerales archaeon]